MGAPPDQALKAASAYQQNKNAQAQPQSSPEPSSGGNWFTSKNSLFNATNLGGAGGAAAGAAIGTLLLPGIGTLAGGALGGLLGGGAGEAGRETLNHEHISGKDIATQGVIGGVSGLAGEGLGMGLKALRPVVGGLLSEGGESLATKALGITGGEAKTFAKQTGESLGDTLAKNNLIGADAAKVKEATQAMQDSYDAIARTSKLKVPLADVRSKFLSTVQPMLESASTEDHGTAEKILNEYESIERALKPDADGMVDIGNLTQAKSTFQGKVNWNRPPDINNMHQQIANTLLGTVNDAADRAGLTTANGSALSDTGKELSKLYKVNTLAQAASNTTAPAKVLNVKDAIFGTVGGAVGSVVGGPVGTVVGGGAGIIGERMLNSPKALAALSKLATSAGDRVASGATSAAGKAASAGANGLGRVAAQDVGSAFNPGPPVTASPGGMPPVPGQPSPQSPSSSVPGTQGDALSKIASAQPSSGVTAQTGSTMTRDQLNRVIALDTQRTGGRNIATFKAMYDAQNPQVSQSVQDAVVGANAATSLINQLYQSYQSAYGNDTGLGGRISGGIRSAVGNITGNSKPISDFEAQSKSFVPALNMNLSGINRFNEAEVSQIMAAIPRPTDTATQAAAKIAAMRDLIASHLQAAMKAPITTGDITANGQ